MRAVAALYVDPRGPYFGMPGVDPWDKARNAELYAGPHPVVARLVKLARGARPLWLSQEAG